MEKLKPFHVGKSAKVLEEWWELTTGTLKHWPSIPWYFFTRHVNWIFYRHIARLVFKIEKSNCLQRKSVRIPKMCKKQRNKYSFSLFFPGGEVGAWSVSWVAVIRADCHLTVVYLSNGNNISPPHFLNGWISG